MVFLDECGLEIGQTEVGPFDFDTNIGSFDFTSEVDEVDLAASIVDCDGNLLEDGFLLVNDRIYLDIENGQVNESIVLCDQSEVSIIAFSSDFSENSESTILQFEETLNVGELTVCGGVETTINFVNILLVNTETNEERRFIFNDITAFPCSGVGQLPDNNQSIELDFFSSISNPRESIVNPGETSDDGFLIELNHINGCPANLPNIRTHFFQLDIIEDGERVIYLTQTREEQNTAEGSVTSYGENPGDLIKGTITSDQFFRIDQLDDTDEVFSVSVSFELTLQ